MNSILGVSPINTIAQNQALAWVVALRADNLSNQALDDFAGWLAESESHREAWSWALDTWETLGVVSHLKTESLLMTEVATPAFQWLRSAFSVDALRNRLLPAAMALPLLRCLSRPPSQTSIALRLANIWKLFWLMAALLNSTLTLH